MTLFLADRVFETSTTTGTTTMVLLGAVTGFRSFVAAGMTGKKVPYVIDQGASWEAGIGTITAGPDTLTRNTIVASSNAGAAVTFGSGTKNVRLANLAEIMAVVDENLNLVDGFGTITNTGNAYSLTLPAKTPLGLSDGMEVWGYASATNTGAATLNVNGLGARSIKVGSADPVSGDITLNGLVGFKYRLSDTTWQWINPPQKATRANLSQGAIARSNVMASQTATFTTTNALDYIPCNASGGAFTVNLHTAVGNAGEILEIEKTDSTLNQITIDANGTETIGGKLVIKLSTQYESVVLVSDGANWRILSRKYPREWVSYTPTFNGFGTPSAVSIWSRRNGDSLEVRGKFTLGTATAVEARLTLGYNGVDQPAGLTSDATKVPSIMLTGFGAFSVAAAQYATMLIESAVAYLTFGNQSSTQQGLTKQTGTGFAGTGNTFSFNASIPINGWED